MMEHTRAAGVVVVVAAEQGSMVGRRCTVNVVVESRRAQQWAVERHDQPLPYQKGKIVGGSLLGTVLVLDDAGSTFAGGNQFVTTSGTLLGTISTTNRASNKDKESRRGQSLWPRQDRQRLAAC